MTSAPGYRDHPEHALRQEQVDIELRVELNGVLIARSSGCILIEEGDRPARYYFPRADVDMSKLHRTQTTTHCPFKGLAHHYNICVDGVTLQDAAWTYEDPYVEHSALRDRIAFRDDSFRELAVLALA